MMRTTTAVSLNLAMICVVFVGTVFADDTPSFKITVKRSQDRIEVQSEENNVVFVVRSPSGIGGATIERTAECWPERMILRLRLSALENFKLTTAELKLEASISSQTSDVRLWKDGQEGLPLDSKSPYWMDVRILDSDKRPTKTLPLQDGYFEMQLPKKPFEGNPRSYSVNWIDFYRN